MQNLNIGMEHWTQDASRPMSGVHDRLFKRGTFNNKQVGPPDSIFINESIS